MARQILQRFSAIGLCIAAALLVVGPVLLHGAPATLAANTQQDASADFTPFWVQTFTPTIFVERRPAQR